MAPVTLPDPSPLRSRPRTDAQAELIELSTWPELTYRYLSAVDIEGFSSLYACDQLQMQTGLGQALDIAAARSGLDRSRWHSQVSGDGELAVLPPDTDGLRLIADYPHELACALHEVNNGRRQRVRIRLALHHGPIIQGRFGPAGDSPVVVSRLLDSDDLRQYLSQRTALDLVTIVSASLHRDVIETRLHHLNPAEFVGTQVQVKGKCYEAYIHCANDLQGLKG
jgi:hypothetical protein